MAKPDSDNIDRLPSGQNTGPQFSGPVAMGGGIQTPPPVPKCPHIANAEPVSAGEPPATHQAGRSVQKTTPPPPDGFLTADGAFDSHALELANGQPNTNQQAGKPYRRTTWADVRRMVERPAARPKIRAPLVILSQYVGHDGRTHAVQAEHGIYCGLAADVDQGNPSLDDVVSAVRAAIGNVRAEVYSSSSAEEGNRKWRVLVPLADPLPGIDYPETQLAFFELLQRHGLACDESLSRVGQPVFLPNIPPKRRGPDGAPLFYQWEHLEGPPLQLAAGHPVVELRGGLAHAHELEEQQRHERAEESRRKRLAHVAATGDTFEPIAHFNANHTVADMLARYGFQPNPAKPNNYRHPESQTGSWATQDRGAHWVCLSQWAVTLNAGRPTKGGHRAGDAFDLFTAFEHGGDRSAAVRSYAQEVRPNGGPNADQSQTLPAPPEPPPGRIEHMPAPTTVPLEELRADLRRDMAAVVGAMPSLVVVNAGTGVGKTERAVELLAGAYDRVVWVCTTHDAANETVARLQAAGHGDVAAIPPRDATTCRCWTAEDVAALAEEFPANRYMVPMEAALRVGNPHMACLACPLSGLANKPVAVPDAAFAEFTGQDTGTTQKSEEFSEAGSCSCQYMLRKADAEAAKITVMCQARYIKAELPPVPMGTTRAIVIDEHGTAAVLPSQSFTLDAVRATRDALATAVDTWRNRKGKMRFGAAREKEAELVDFGDAVRGVADKLVANMEALAAAGTRRVEGLPPLALPAGDVPKRTHNKIARLLVNAALPAGFNAEVLDVIRRAAAQHIAGAVVYAEPRLNGTTDVQLVVGGNVNPAIDDPWIRDTLRELQAAHDDANPPGENRQTRFVIDADADLAAIRKAFPDVVEIAPRGAAPLEHHAAQWWFEINPQTHPAVVVRMLELAIHEHGFKAAGVVLPLAHRRILFPVTRPRNGRPAEDKEPDPAAIASWGGRGGRALAGGTAEQRMERAVALVERLRQLRQFIARDEQGRLLVEHHRGTTTRGSNRFLAGTDGGVVLGCTRANPGAVAAYMLGTGRADAVQRSHGDWGDVEGELPAVGGGTTKRRWRGYACPEWAEASRLVNRAELTQTCARFRPTLEHGKPLVVVAAEPTGLPVTDPPATIPEGVAAVVGAVRELMARPKVVPTCEDGQAAAGGENSRRHRVSATEKGSSGGWNGGESRHRSIEHTFSPIFLDGWRDSPGVSVADVFGLVAVPKRSVERWLADAVARGLLVRTGAGRGTRYGLAGLLTEKSHSEQKVNCPAAAVQVVAPPVGTGDDLVVDHNDLPPKTVVDHDDQPVKKATIVAFLPALKTCGNPQVLPAAEPLELVHQLADLEEANAALAEAAAMDQAEQEPPTPRRPSRARPNAPAAPRTPGDWFSSNTSDGNATKTPTRPADVPDGGATVLVALANARRKIHDSTLWRDRSTWSALRAAIPPPRL